MNVPVVGVKYRIQNADFPMYLELTDNGERVRLRGKKDSDLQYWQFDGESNGFHYIRSAANKDKRLALSDFAYSHGVVSPVWLSNASNPGTYNLTGYQPSYITLFVYASEDDPTFRISIWTAEHPITGANWQLVPEASPQICSNPLPPGNYRIRNYNGSSLLTMHHGYSLGQGVVSANVYVRSQHHESPYQRWTVTPQQSGQYIIQNAGTNSYLGCGKSTPVGDNTVVPSRTAYLWDIPNIGGLAWSIRIPGTDMSIGVPTDEMKDKDKMSFVPSDFTPSQIWFFESYFPFGQDEIYAKREVAEGKYLLQNVVRNTNQNNASIYMNVVSSPWRICPGIDTTCKFELKYIDNSSPCFTLTYVTNTTESLIVADVGGYIGLSDAGTEFVLLQRNQGDPGYVICRPDSGHPLKVVSGRITTDLSNNSVFSIENQVAGDTYQMWKLVPTY